VSEANYLKNVLEETIDRRCFATSMLRMAPLKIDFILRTQKCKYLHFPKEPS
jgi:hypothetical protein